MSLLKWCHFISRDREKIKFHFIFRIFFTWGAVWISELISHAEEMVQCQEIMQSSVLGITAWEDVVSHSSQSWFWDTGSFDANGILHRWSQIPGCSFPIVYRLTLKQELSSEASWLQTVHTVRATCIPLSAWVWLCWCHLKWSPIRIYFCQPTCLSPDWADH